MNTNRIFLLSLLVMMGLAVLACAPTLQTGGQPTLVTPPPPASRSATAEPTHTTETPMEVEPTKAITSSTASVSPTSLPTIIAAPAADELDCMGACHEIDINELFGAGAKSQPAHHRGRTTCLSCHATLAKPALPATHLGRLDAACNGCHKSN